MIDTGTRKVVYREAGPSLYEGVEVELGPHCGEFYPVVKGLEAGDRVATDGSFLIDAESRLVGGLDSTSSGATVGPRKDKPAAATSEIDKEVETAFKQFSPEDRKVAEEQVYCPILKTRLGTMGVPVKVMLKGWPVFLCCPLCVDKAKADAQRTLDKVGQLRGADR